MRKTVIKICQAPRCCLFVIRFRNVVIVPGITCRAWLDALYGNISAIRTSASKGPIGVRSCSDLQIIRICVIYRTFGFSALYVKPDLSAACGTFSRREPEDRGGGCHASRKNASLGAD